MTRLSRPHPSPTTLPRAWLREALAVVAPVVCAGCGAPDEAVCAGCRERLLPAPVVVPLPSSEVSFPVTAGLEYGGAVAALLGAAKERHRADTLRLLAPALLAALERLELPLASAPTPAVQAVAMPSAAAARRRRGFGAVEVVLRAANVPMQRRALTLVRDVADQAGLSAGERHGNLAGAMTASPRLRGLPVLLVDDVVTTGSTLAEAARAVRRAGGSVVGAACVAYSVKRGVTRRELIGDRHAETDVA